MKAYSAEKQINEYAEEKITDQELQDEIKIDDNEINIEDVDFTLGVNNGNNRQS